MENPMLLIAGLGGILAIGGAVYFIIRRRRSQHDASVLDAPSLHNQDLRSVMLDSAFSGAGGEIVDTSRLSRSAEFSQIGTGAIDADDEVDPVAEADVYMAYGRDAQAEEILLEARKKNPKRTAIIVKLLEIYFNRNDARQFESLAPDLYSQTEGKGDDWEKAVVMGQALIPENPMFGSVSKPAKESAAPISIATTLGAGVVDSISHQIGETVVMPGELSRIADNATREVAVNTEPLQAAIKEQPAAQQGTAKTDFMSLDFDLGLDENKRSNPFDTPTDKQGAGKDTAQERPAALDFDLVAMDSASLPDETLDSFEPRQPEFSEHVEEDKGNQIDFSLDPLADDSKISADFPVDAAGGNGFEAQPASPVEEELPPFDMSSISLDLQNDNDEAKTSTTLSSSIIIGPALESTQIFGDAVEEAEKKAKTESEQIANSMQNLLPEQDFLGAGNLKEGIDSQGFDMPDDALDIASGADVMATKLDLAKVYEEMGDKEGARELLLEVIKEGDSVQQGQAKALLAKLGM